MPRYRLEVDTRRLDKLARETGTKAGEMIRKIALDTVTDIGMSWSAESPAPPGGAPGVDTGALKNSIYARQTGPKTWVLGDGVEYGVWLEFGAERMPARPWLAPAIERARERLPEAMRKVVLDE